jgi:L-aspartate oxidase
VHADGAETGKRIIETLAQRVLRHPRIRVREGERVVALSHVKGGCSGAVSERGAVRAPATLLACGGYAALWQRTTNPAGAIGDGLTLAYAAGAALADLELVQFHPTALLDDGLLLTEALRGDGALLLDERGERFTDELAPRDVVARAIDARRQAGLDLRAVDRDRYPGLIATLERAGYDPAREPVPVAPAAHYTIGGIVTDLDGRTTLPGLYAAGEAAATGVHGANRLASNSLLECLVFGRRAALAGLAEPAAGVAEALPADPPERPPSQATRHALWQHAGLSREAAGLSGLLELDSVLVRLVAACALAREESRGVHFRSDRSREDEALAGKHLVLRRGSEPHLESWA